MNGNLQNENKLVGTLSGRGSVNGGLGSVIGRDGKSAYEVALKNGFEGTEAEWLAALKGDKGDKGDTGAKGDKGDTGATGAQGIQGEQGIQGIQGDKGDKGDQGDKGDKGDKGDTGDAFTYDDFTEEQLAALKGDKGDKGDKGEQGATGISGYSPVKGKDYWTEADRTEIIEELGDEITPADIGAASLKDLSGYIPGSITPDGEAVSLVTVDDLNAAVEELTKKIGTGGGMSVEDDGDGNVTIASTSGVSITDDGNGNVVIA